MSVDHNHIELTASEISTLWTAYQSNTLAYQGSRYFLYHMKDPDIAAIFKKSSAILENNIQKQEAIFEKENYPIPQGFTEKDVTVDAPQLVSDKLCLDYLFNATVLTLAQYSASLVSAERNDIVAFYSQALTDTQQLHIEAKTLSKEKGIYIRSPKLPTPNQIDFVHKQSFLSGWWWNRRPLLGVEITNLVFNAKRNALGQSMITAFSQVAQAKEVRKYFEQGAAIAKKHMVIFNEKLYEDNVSEGTVLTTSGVTDSTVSPFTDKFMMTLVTTLIASGLAQYGAAMAASPRQDLGIMYTRLMAEIASYSKDGATLMIENGWMEQPPMTADRKELAK